MRSVKLKAFNKFADTTEVSRACITPRAPPIDRLCVQALAATTALVDSALDKKLKKFLKKNIVSKGIQDKVRVCAPVRVRVHGSRACVAQLGVADSKLGGLIKEELGIKVRTLFASTCSRRA